MASELQIAVLSATSVDKRFNALVVLNQVNFAVSEREAVGIVGPNGAGKTTLLNILAGAYQPSAGTVSSAARMLPPFRSRIAVAKGLRDRIKSRGPLAG